MDLTGKIIAIMPANSGVSQRTGNPWMSQEYVIEVPGQYTRRCMFRLFGEDRIKQFNIQMGQDYTVSFDIDAHEYNGRWFNEIRAFNVQPAVCGAIPAAAPFAAPTQQPAQPQPTASPFPPTDSAPAEESNDDLPF